MPSWQPIQVVHGNISSLKFLILLFVIPFALSPHSLDAPVDSNLPKQCLIEIPQQKKTFAQALNNACDIPLSQLPRLCLKGDALAIKIPEEKYKACLEGYKNHLHGRLILQKGDALMKVLSCDPNYQFSGSRSINGL